MELSVYDCIGQGYEDIWFTNCQCRYRALKGGRNTKKSTDIGGIEPIFKILSNSFRNIIMCRQNDVDNADSTFPNIVKWINTLGLSHLFRITTSPYKITYKATGQVIVFRGCNNPTSVTSIRPVVGEYTDIYFEEASELKSYEDFRKMDGTIRGKLPDGVYHQITFMFNAWDVGHWLYDIFFKDRLEDNADELEECGYQFMEDPDFNLGYGKGLALHISSYKINEFRTDEYSESMENLKEKAYEIYKVEGLGCWGNTTDAVYDCWSDKLILEKQLLRGIHFDAVAIGIDTGLSDGQGTAVKNEEVGSAMSMHLVGIADNYNKLIVINEYYHTNIGERVKKTEPQYQEEMIAKIAEWCDIYDFMWQGVTVFVDCADIGFRQGLALMAERRMLRGVRFEKSTKLKIYNRIKVENHLMAFGELLISDSCKNLIREIKACHRGKKGEWRADTNDHAINSFEYGWAPLGPRLRRWKTFKFQQ